MNDVAQRDEGASVPTSREQRAEALLPPVDIFEQGNALHVIADMPGVTHESLSIEVDNNVLSLEGEVRIEMPEGLAAIYAEVRAQRFVRRFTLSHEIDTDAIQARIENGVVHLVLPKKETHRTRRIEVQPA
ncbi:Hsp20/alpha crystallin family protein [Halomonas heilongjiangensis]|uniref:Heat-shock protein n=1 Tax=Halomonas heilongjiangensis TaxID=1387883 RepID=A0A2N7TM07_9GAMM|nr:Hsp20/alpha crystallin family protein [Halomonas heilongjiangensis]PMR69158.1 heat-shock protein [Halomonas heilongjiangensis]PXX94184.1 heat-shock protein [Halomonas heilongjiangensis]